ncbi:MAG: DUF421 domain-containing protein [Oscillospiraceae bacterium]|nr:DUF421 domain-containing protein [Oscillospiraceae bacterium]
MDILKVILATFGSLIALFILTKLIGNKQISELNMFDYVNGITIGSIAAEMATTLDSSFIQPLIAMVIYALVTFVLSIAANKNMKIRRLFTGRSIFIYDKGKIFKENLKVAKLDVNEFLAQCRIQGYFSLDEIETAILESNGKISILPKAQNRPCTPSDLAISVPKERPGVNVILDGEILERNLKYTGNDENWLAKQLKKQGKTVKEVFLGVCNSDNNLEIFDINKEKPLNDIFG